MIKLLVAASGGFPLMDFSFGQIPGYFQSEEFFVLASQTITQILQGISTAFINLIVAFLFGLVPLPQ